MTSELELQLYRKYGAGVEHRQAFVRYERSDDSFIVTDQRWGPRRVPFPKGYRAVIDDHDREPRARKPRRDKYPEGQRPSELRRKIGTRSRKRLGLYQCLNRGSKEVAHRYRFYKRNSRTLAKPCDWLIISEPGEKYPHCTKCGRRVWVVDRMPLYEHDDLHVLREMIQYFRAWRGRNPHATISIQRFSEWGERIEQRLTVQRFYELLPWHLKNFRSRVGVVNAR